MLDVSTGFLIAGQKAPVLSRPAPRTYPVEDCRDIFSALHRFDPVRYGDGPTFPTVTSRVYPILDAMEQTTRALGSRPAPEEVDRSNLRRLIRALEPLADAYQDAFKEKKLKKGMAELGTVGKALGKYKDLAVIETEIRGLSPDGTLPRDIRKALEKEKSKRLEQFVEAYDRFRDKGLKRAVEALTTPRGLEGVSASGLEKMDRQRMAWAVTDRLDEVDQVGLEHRDPEAFHEGRKALRTALYSVNASTHLFDFPEPDVAATTSVVDTFGLAQDCQTARDWLKAHGFKKEAKELKARYQSLQQQALDEARRLAESGALERLRSAAHP